MDLPTVKTIPSSLSIPEPLYLDSTGDAAIYSPFSLSNSDPNFMVVVLSIVYPIGYGILVSKNAAISHGVSLLASRIDFEHVQHLSCGVSNCNKQ
jgi:hypothetical protein